MLAAEQLLTLDEIAQRVTADSRGNRTTARQVELELRGNATQYRRVDGYYVHKNTRPQPPSKLSSPTPVNNRPDAGPSRLATPNRGSEPALEKLAAAWLARDPRLWAWQTRALAAWEANDRRGVVTAVTGSGKTNVGIAAIAEFVRGGGQAAVIVPTIELLEQWSERLVGWGAIPPHAIGKLDGTSKDALLGKDVLVCVVNTAAKLLPERLRAAFRPVLLVADECHRYGAETFAAALDGRYRFQSTRLPPMCYSCATWLSASEFVS